MGGGYPGSHGCNDLIPHAKWHGQTSAALADMTRLVDFVVELEKKHSSNKVDIFDEMSKKYIFNYSTFLTSAATSLNSAPIYFFQNLNFHPFQRMELKLLTMSFDFPKTLKSL